ncbi:SusD/RagB family nutrient-binding outer membrane lipoprotein [Rapidithrix thailandica]|uniref:SusD/RagB family nutrient-binding outer membrane lipoprotein n=1 Tax=Rapidithrix thailandica TaxID=413964 RepID=A0AAW9SBL5_9BACT
MKKLFNISFSLIGLMILLVGCDSFLGGDTNTDPYRATPDLIKLDALLPTVIKESGDNHYRIAYSTSQIAQHTASYFASGADIHEITRINSAWTGIYLRALTNADQMVKLAEENGSPHYAGVAQVLMALNLGMATDLWENIPFDEAFKGPEILKPAYQAQEEIYNRVNSLLDAAIPNLQAATSVFSPSDDDLIYKGDLSKWEKVAYALKARYAIHLANKGDSYATMALTELENAIDGIENDFELIYNSRNLNPWHSQVGLPIKTGNYTITHSAQFIKCLNGDYYTVVDPRLPIIADKGGNDNYSGMINGSGSGSTTNLTVDTWYASSEAPIMMVTYAEMKFIEAEAAFLANGGTTTSVGAPQQAYEAYLEGITAHMQKLGVEEAEVNAYLADPNVAVGAANLTLELIMKEKYIALFLHPEAWIDVRRYNYNPDVFHSMTLPENHNPDLNGNFLQRASYPFDELSRNSGEVDKNTKEIGSRMWRDQ